MIKDSLNVASPTALRTMAEFQAIGLVDNKDTGSSHITEIILKPKFDWFLTEEFKKLRDDYKPEKYTETEKNDTSDEHGGPNNANCGTNDKRRIRMFQRGHKYYRRRSWRCGYDQIGIM